MEDRWVRRLMSFVETFRFLQVLAIGRLRLISRALACQTRRMIIPADIGVIRLRISWPRLASLGPLALLIRRQGAWLCG
jgi:hypothetical protein